MYCATFIFKKKQFDDRFHELDQAIADFAKTTQDYIGEQTWENAETGCIANHYYWSSMDGLKQLMQHPKHLEAKGLQGNWLAGYQVVISQVLRSYGDGGIDHPASALQHAALHGDTIGRRIID